MIPICLIDHSPYRIKDYENIYEVFKDDKDLIKTHGETFHFKVVGVLYSAGISVVVFPKNYESFNPSKNLFKESSMLIRLLIRYHQENRFRTDLFSGDDNRSFDLLGDAVFLIEDWALNGDIVKSVSILEKTGSGKIHWSKTIQTEQPVISSFGPVYINPIRKRVKNRPDHWMLRTYHFVLNQMFERFGWFFGYDQPVLEEVLPFPLEEVLYRLKKELRTVFQDREIRIIRTLIHWLEQTSGDLQNSIQAVTVKNFEFVWEAVCGYITDNQYPKLQRLLPQPVWLNFPGGASLYQRPDIYMLDEKTLYILDAKYYDYHVKHPGWHDAVKQFFYRLSLLSVKDRPSFRRLLPGVQEIKCAFLLPGGVGDPEDLGTISVPEALGFGEIRTMTINQKKALYSYTYRNMPEFNQHVKNKIRSICDKMRTD